MLFYEVLAVDNVVEVESSKIEVKSSVETKEENTYIAIHRESLYQGEDIVRNKGGKGP